MNVLVSRLERIEPPVEQPAGTLAGVEGMARVRAAAPEGQSFGRGRR